MIDEQPQHDDLEHDNLEQPSRPPTYLERNGGVPLEHPRRCQAVASGTGELCRKYAIKGGNVCRTHGGSAPQVIAKAKERLELAADRMANRLLGIAESDNVPAYVALAATDSALDRAGLKPTTAVNVGITAPWEEVLQAVGGIAQITRAESRAARGLAPAELPPGDPSTIVDAEVVEDRGEGTAVDTPSRPVGPQNPPPPGTGLQTLEDAASELRRRPGAM